DGRTDLAVVGTFSDNVTVLIGNGDGTFVNPKTYPVGRRPVAIVEGRVRTGPLGPDLAVASQTDEVGTVLLGQGGGRVRPFREAAPPTRRGGGRRGGGRRGHEAGPGGGRRFEPAPGPAGARPAGARGAARLHHPGRRADLRGPGDLRGPDGLAGHGRRG